MRISSISTEGVWCDCFEYADYWATVKTGEFHEILDFIG